MPDADLADLYRAHGALALPSLTDAESFGMVAAEAAACGLPVVASAVGGVPSLVEDGATGILVPPGDPGALAEALGDLARDPGRASDLGRRGAARVASRYGWRGISEATDLLFEEAIAASRRAPRGTRSPTRASRSGPSSPRGRRGSG